MQSGLVETQNRDSKSARSPPFPPITAQHGSDRPHSSLHGHSRSPPLRARSALSDNASVGGGDIDVDELDQTLGRLNVAEEAKSAATAHATVAGQRIAEYENAAVAASPRHGSRPVPGFKVTGGSSRLDGVQLIDFPNEILTQILSHLHPDSHGAVALVSKRFYALVTTPYAWRAAFLRYFAGQESASSGHHAKAVGSQQQARDAAEAADVIRSEVRYFTRLTPLASWRSEYLLRTRLLRSVVRGKPGSIGASIRSSQSGKKASAVLTYNSKLPWMISHLHADFAGGKKGPRVIHGTRDLSVATVSDPTTGRIEKWGLDDPFSFQQLDEVFPNLEFYGVGEGPSAVPNVMDVSQLFGFVGGEGFPGGRVYYKAAGQLRGHYLDQDHGMADPVPEIPKIPGLADAVSSIWIAKSSNVTSVTQSMVGIMAGSTLGVVTCYALGPEPTGPRYADGDMTARWVLCPGVPIIDIKVDDQYSLRRKALCRVWAVALNALGEVFYLTEVPRPRLHKGKAEDAVKDAWNAGRTAFWELIEATRRTASPDEFDKNAVAGTYSPRSSADSMDLSRDQIAAEAREIEHFFRHTPAHFRKACEGWDMLRRLEVDFAGGIDAAGGEAIAVVTGGTDEGLRPSVRRYVKGVSLTEKGSPLGALTPVAQPVALHGSIFGGNGAVQPSLAAALVHGNGTQEASSVSGLSTPRLSSVSQIGDANEWRCSELLFKHSPNTEITASAVDMSSFAVMTAFEDPLLSGPPATGTSSPATPTSKHSTGEIPGRRARLLAIGTNTGSVVVWNMRDAASPVVHPLRVIQTESPEITTLALSALYLVHGGSDSLVQAWDPLASSLEPMRTLNAKSSGRIPRHILAANPALQHANYFAVRAVRLDPDPAVLRGVLAFGTFVRFWSYSSTAQPPGRKRRLRHADVVHGRAAGRRGTGTVSSYIAAEEAELRREEEHRARERDRLSRRFGVDAVGGLSEEEALQYARMISEEAFLMDEQRRLSSAGDTTASSEGGETASSSAVSAETATPEPSVAGGPSGAGLAVLEEEESAEGGVVQQGGGEDDDYEAQIQRAIRLSLLEGVASEGHLSSSPTPGVGSGERVDSAADAAGSYEYEFQVKVGKGKGKGKGRAASMSPGGFGFASGSGSGSGAAVFSAAEYAAADAAGGEVGVDAEDDLALALRMSLEEEEARLRRVREREAAEAGMRGVGGEDEYPPLEVKGKGKGKWV